MSLLREHDVSLYARTSTGARVALTPLRDEHLPLLYRWNADTDVLYWTEGEYTPGMTYTPEQVRGMYGGVSRVALCFLVRCDGEPVGECWLQPMNLLDLQALYRGRDVRRIDMMIGEPSYWGQGIGTAMVRALTAYAFLGERVDALHCIVDETNPRSYRTFLSNGYEMRAQDSERHLTIARAAYARGTPPVAAAAFSCPLRQLAPSAAAVSAGKLALAREWFPEDGAAVDMDPLLVRPYGDRYLLLDGHARALLALASGRDAVPARYASAAETPTDPMARAAWCRDEGVESIEALRDRVVSHAAYEATWNRRCWEAGV